MANFTYTDDKTGMTVSADSDSPLEGADIDWLFNQAQKQSAEKLNTGMYKLADDGFTELEGKDATRALKRHTARAMGVGEDLVDVESGMGVVGRGLLALQPTSEDKFKHLIDTYGKENIRGVQVGNDVKYFYRDEDETNNQFRMVDEVGASIADFTGDLLGAAAPIAGSVAGAIKGAGAGTAVAPGPGTLIGGVLGAAAGGFAAGSAQDVATRAISGEELQLGEIGKRRGVEAGVGAIADVALLGAGKAVAKPFLSRMTGDATAKAFSEAGELLPEGALTPRMLQGEEALTRELGIEKNLAGRVGAARKALDAKARDLVSESNPAAYDRFAAKVTAERESLEKSIPAQERALLDRVSREYNERLQGFGAGDGRVLSSIGDDVLENSTNPAFQQARQIKNELYGQYDTLDKQVGGVFQPASISKVFGGVIERNRLKNNSAIRGIQKEIDGQTEAFTLGEIDDLIARVTDAMPEGVVKDKTAQQLASELADSLSDIVKRKAKQFPELEQAWRRANQYYKDTFLQFNRGAVGGAVREVSGRPVLSGQQFITQVLKDPREVQAVLSVAKEGGQSPHVVESRLKEAFLSIKGIHKGEPVSGLTLSASDRGVIEELWGKRGLKRMTSISKGLKASPEQLDEYLGALSDKSAASIRKELVKQSRDIDRLEQIKKNTFMRELANGNLPAGADADIAKAYLKMPKARRSELFDNMGEAAKEELRGVVGSSAIFDGAAVSPFKDAMGEHLFNGETALKRLVKDKDALTDLMGSAEYNKLKKLANAQRRLKPLSHDEARAKLRTLAGPGGFSLYIVGDIISAMRDKFISLAYRTKSLDGLMNGWQKLDTKSLNRALKTMLYGAQSRRAIEDIDDPEFESQLDLLREAIPEK